MVSILQDQEEFNTKGMPQLDIVCESYKFQLKDNKKRTHVSNAQTLYIFILIVYILYNTYRS